MKKSLYWLFALGAASALAAGCASDPTKSEVAAGEPIDCRGVAPATGTLLRKKEDCVARVPIPPEQLELDEMRKPRGTPIRGGGG